MYSNYSEFNEEEFITDEYFQKWVWFPDADNKLFWENWQVAHPEKTKAVLAAKAFLENLSFQDHSPSQQQVEASLATSLAKITDWETSFDAVSDKPVKKYSMTRWLVAAALVGSICIGGLIVFQKREPVTIEQIAGAGEIKTLTLPDSSVVTLNAGSHITYASTLGNNGQRDVWLNGEAFFDVQHSEQNGTAKRFVVHTKDMDIEVLGTTFNVKKRNGITNVSLNSGKIKLSLRDDPGTTIYLQPGDFIRYSSTERKMLKKKVQADLYSVWKEEKLVMDGMPLTDIARLLEDAYGYNIVLKEKSLGESKISGTLHVRDESALLETLAFALNINIIKKDSVLFFQSKN